MIVLVLVMLVLVGPVGVRAGEGRGVAADTYRTVAEVEQELRGFAVTYPALATVVDYGDSWEKTTPGGLPGFDLLALRMSSGRFAGPKPVLTVVAALHANEMATVEVALRFSAALLEGYAVDPTSTMLLDANEIVVVAVANPDGRALPTPTRKTTTRAYHPSCFGVDLNRNFPFAWGAVARSDSPCATNYLGPAPASEPETQALMALLGGLYPDRAFTGMEPVAPDTSGVLISLHTFGDLVLYPWAQTPEAAPNKSGLARLAGVFGVLTGYTPLSAYELYPHAGRFDDWAYATLGVAAFTFEIGSSSMRCGGHFAPYDCVDSDFWPENAAALRYAALATQAPYTAPAGPTVTELAATKQDTTLFVTATLVAPTGGLVAGAEFYATPLHLGGAPVALRAKDGIFDEAIEQAEVQIPVDELDFESGGERRPLLVRAQSQDGVWGVYGATWTVEAVEAYRLGLPLIRR